uniref:Uncharacterized protein n=1 Tax=Oryza brachyantha TaxID=4533 RepID=J3KX85_ORYBR
MTGYANSCGDDATGAGVTLPSTLAMLVMQMMLPLRWSTMTRAPCLTPARTQRMLIAMTTSKLARSSEPSGRCARSPRCRRCDDVVEVVVSRHREVDGRDDLNYKLTTVMAVVARSS